MIARRSVWADEVVQELLESFVPAADEVGRLQRGQDPDARLFLSFCEEGHYGGRTEPSGTRQGIYAVAPGGAFLASVNTRSPRAMEKMLRRALQRWDELPADQRGLPPNARAELGAVRRWRDAYPADGLVLEVTSRDLEPRGRTRDWRRHAWNLDHAWFKKDEAAAFVPGETAVGAAHAVPETLVARLARFHLIDNVRGQTTGFPADAVERAALRSEPLRPRIVTAHQDSVSPCSAKTCGAAEWQRLRQGVSSRAGGMLGCGHRRPAMRSSRSRTTS